MSKTCEFCGGYSTGFGPSHKPGCLGANYTLTSWKDAKKTQTSNDMLSEPVQGLKKLKTGIFSRSFPTGTACEEFKSKLFKSARLFNQKVAILSEYREHETPSPGYWGYTMKLIAVHLEYQVN